jgi:methionyl-tRNA formyltransferase
MTKVVLCGYRVWAKKIFHSIKLNTKVTVIDVISSQEEYLQKIYSYEQDIDLILFIGWSWIIPKDITIKFLCMGIHPSDLPNYRGGSPIQHQIINGLKISKISLMTLSPYKLDAGEIWMQEQLDLTGDTMEDVFNNIATSSINLLDSFFDLFPNITPKEQDSSIGSYYKRRAPNDSLLSKEQLNEMSLSDIYNFIRALTDPYPNAYIEDEKGNKLIFKEVSYIENRG